MDVIGNNIANVNTTGYKTSRVIFQDIFSQTAAGGSASAPQFNIGGTNPMQIGLGIKLASVDVMHTPAPFARTDNPFDMMIGGDGFFIVEGPDGYFYTRAGNFKLDDQGWLTTTDGFFVMGYSSNVRIVEEEIEEWDPDIPGFVGTGEFKNVVVPEFVDPAGNAVFGAGLSRIQLKAFEEAYADDPGAWDWVTDGAPFSIDLLGFTVGQNGDVTILADNKKVTIAKIAVAMFANPGGLEKAGRSLYRETNSSGAVNIGMPYQDGAGTVEGGGLEMSNVDLATEFTDMIVTQRGFQANSRVITVSDTMLEELVNLKR